jgi:GNAT superfamily N-acetyltransferase
MRTFTIRAYDPQRDASQVYLLWQHTLHRLWPLSRETFRAVTVAHPRYQQGDHFVALSGEELVGWVATQLLQKETLSEGYLLALLVVPSAQRKGVGRMLHDHALFSLKQRGAATIHLGGGFSYFWQGVPANLPGAWSFFQACGWKETERSFDLLQDLAGYVTPSGVYERLPPTITIAPATSTDAQAILVFEDQHFPQWSPYYSHLLRHQSYTDIVVAKTVDGQIVGTAQIVDPQTPGWNDDIRWLSLLGRQTGGIGILGVAEFIRGRGIGLALAARVTELVQERGLERSYVGWTGLVDWYGKLGYQIWQTYIMSWQNG